MSLYPPIDIQGRNRAHKTNWRELYLDQRPLHYTGQCRRENKYTTGGLPGLFPGSRSIEEVTVTVDGVGLILSRKVQEDDPPTAWLKRG